ncbi:hypothetical protein D021_1722B, partial [Vibrio parahaemolyticus 10296]
HVSAVKYADFTS